MITEKSSKWWNRLIISSSLSISRGSLSVLFCFQLHINSIFYGHLFLPIPMARAFLLYHLSYLSLSSTLCQSVLHTFTFFLLLTLLFSLKKQLESTVIFFCPNSTNVSVHHMSVSLHCTKLCTGTLSRPYPPSFSTN